MEEKTPESILEQLLTEIGGPMKTSCTASYDLVKKCAEENIYKALPEFIHGKFKLSQSGMEQYKRGMKEVSRICSSDESTDIKLRDIYGQIVGDIRKGVFPLLTFADTCYFNCEGIPDEVMQLVQPAMESITIFRKSNNKISEILRQLPAEKLKEYKQYQTDVKKQ